MNVTNSVEQKILDTKEYLMYDSIYMKFKKQAKLSIVTEVRRIVYLLIYKREKGANCMLIIFSFLISDGCRYVFTLCKYIEVYS